MCHNINMIGCSNLLFSDTMITLKECVKNNTITYYTILYIILSLFIISTYCRSFRCWRFFLNAFFTRKMRNAARSMDRVGGFSPPLFFVDDGSEPSMVSGLLLLVSAPVPTTSTPTPPVASPSPPSPRTQAPSVFTLTFWCNKHFPETLSEHLQWFAHEADIAAQYSIVLSQDTRWSHCERIYDVALFNWLWGVAFSITPGCIEQLINWLFKVQYNSWSIYI